MSGSELYIGLMSGTSFDGVDAAVADFAGGKPHCVATAYLPYPEDLRQTLLSLSDPSPDELHRSATLSNRLARIYAEAVAIALGSSHTATQVRAIGCHGQTVRHCPSAGYSIQLNNAALLTELTGMNVVADFRSRDIAAGGQGAPLVPAFHAEVFRSNEVNRCILNIGGISNVTALSTDGCVRGFDCGPGNMLMDAWIQTHLGYAYDTDGNWAASGSVDVDLLGRLLSDTYFDVPPPKSCGREQFGLAWLQERLKGTERPADVQATLAELTAITISDSLRRWFSDGDQLYVCGGGAHNTLLLRRLGNHLAKRKPIPIMTTDALGIPADYVEAMAFAWLARQTILRRPSNLPKVTGAEGERILGAIYPA